MKSLLIVFSILCGCVLTVSAQNTSVVLRNIQPDAYPVYKAVLKELFIKPQTKQIAVRNFTSEPHYSNSKEIEKHNLLVLVQGNFSGRSELVNSYEIMNQQPTKLKDEFQLAIPVIVLNEENLGETLNKIKGAYPKEEVEAKLKEAYNKRYKGMAITFSNVGFNRKRNQALLHVEYDFQGFRTDCLGQFIFLVKESGGWIIKNKLVSWVS